MLMIVSLTILMANDIQPNPGPSKDPCIECNKTVRRNQEVIACNNCELWSHRKCSGLSKSHLTLTSAEEPWRCTVCTGLLDLDPDNQQKDDGLDLDQPSEETSPPDENIFQELTDIRAISAENPTVAFLNINSLRETQFQQTQ